MFTLKMFKRVGSDRLIYTKTVTIDHVETSEIGKETIELRAFYTRQDRGMNYDQFYIGHRETDMSALNDDNHWEWGLLENWEGNTSTHYRPYTYG